LLSSIVGTRSYERSCLGSAIVPPVLLGPEQTGDNQEYREARLERAFILPAIFMAADGVLYSPAEL
jgi:hypothetical protein